MSQILGHFLLTKQKFTKIPKTHAYTCVYNK